MKVDFFCVIGWKIPKIEKENFSIFSSFYNVKCVLHVKKKSQNVQISGSKLFMWASLTLSLLGYLKTRICGGGLIWPPSKSHVWFPNMTNDTSLESSCALLVESAKNLQIFKIKFFIAKSSYMVKMFAKNNFSKKMINYIHCWKALDHAISNMQKFWQNFK